MPSLPAKRSEDGISTAWLAFAIIFPILFCGVAYLCCRTPRFRRGTERHHVSTVDALFNFLN